MRCYINKIKRNSDITSDVKTLIPGAGLRRRMSRIIKTAVATAVDCLGGVDEISTLDAIITATGWGCLADSEKFLRNIIVDKEQMLNPTPFIQSTFNTVGGQIALLKHNHCYNVTYVNRSHSFEDALLDAMMRISDGESEKVLLGAFDEQTPTQHRIMERMGLFKKVNDGEGAVFSVIGKHKDDSSLAQITLIDFPTHSMTENECLTRYTTSNTAVILYNSYSIYGLFPTSSAHSFAKAVDMIEKGEKEIIIYNEYFGATPTVLKIECIG